MTIAVSIRHSLADFNLDVDFESNGRLTSIFGASGSGKTSVVNVIAGLIQPQSARISVDGRLLTDTAKGVQVPVHRRRIGYVFQDARLFPHLTVEQNLAYGRWFAPKAERYADHGQIVRLLGIAHLLPRKPGQLSGGEKQRIAIGRALLASPKLLLMDEPLAALDAPRKAEILPYIERLRDEFHVPIVHVSHSVAEVARLATDIVVMANGSVSASGPAAEILQRLDLIPVEERDEGGIILDMVVDQHNHEFDMTTLRSSAGEAHVQGYLGVSGTRVRVRIRARDVMIATDEPRHISALNVFRGSITAITQADRSAMNISLDCGGSAMIARITRQSCAALGLALGREVFAIVKAVSVSQPGASPPEVY
jgi:molybdate transport system ATP-binding protein